MRGLIAAVGAAACSVALSAAQSGTTYADKMDKGMKQETMMVTGCVTEGANGHYMLTNAMMSGDMKDMKGEMKPMSYNLTGGTNLKAHLGHKVEVTGAKSPEKMMKRDTMGRMHKDKDMDKDKEMDKDKDKDKDMDRDKMMSDMHQTIRVKSVKMLSSSCQ